MPYCAVIEATSVVPGGSLTLASSENSKEVCVHMCVCLCVCAYLRACVHAFVRAYMCLCMHACMCDTCHLCIFMYYAHVYKCVKLITPVCVT